MAQFNLNWFNTAVIINPNVINQRASHRRKSIGGAFITTGWTPANDLPKTASASQSPVVLDNVTWEFKVEAICTEGGPTINDNGLQEGLKFACLAPVISAITINSCTVTLNISNTDITQATFVVHRSSDDVAVAGPTTIAAVGNSITFNVTGLASETEYYVETILYAIVNGSLIQSDDVDQLGTSCISADPLFETLPDVCLPCTDIDATVIEA
jgi:hypothetical protein